MLLLLPRFCAYVPPQTLKKDDKNLAPPEFFFTSPVVGLATALSRMDKKSTLRKYI